MIDGLLNEAVRYIDGLLNEAVRHIDGSLNEAVRHIDGSLKSPGTRIRMLALEIQRTTLPEIDSAFHGASKSVMGCTLTTS